MTANKLLVAESSDRALLAPNTSAAAAAAAADRAATEAIGWNMLCDQFTLRAVRLELQLLETRHRSVLVEEESSHRVFYYNSLLFGITGQAARLARHFTSLMDDVNSMQASHDRLQNERSERVNQIQEYHAKMILEHRSQAEGQAAAFANKIETLRADERELRVRVAGLRQEAEESYAQLDKRRNDSLGERRQLEVDLQRLQGEVSNQKYFLERINAQVEAAKMRLRETERSSAELSSAANAAAIIATTAVTTSSAAGDGMMAMMMSQSRRISPPNTTSGANHHSNNHQGSGNLSQADRYSTAGSLSAPRMSPSPNRHGDSIASGISHVQAIRDMGIDEQFVKYGRTAGTGSPQRFVAASRGGVDPASVTTPRPVAQYASSSGAAAASGSPLYPAAGGMVHSVGLGSSHRFGGPSPIPSSSSRYGGSASGADAALANNNSMTHNNNNNSFANTPGSRSGVVLDHTAPSQWQLRLMKLQGELRSLKTDLGVNSPVTQQRGVIN